MCMLEIQLRAIAESSQRLAGHRTIVGSVVNYPGRLEAWSLFGSNFRPGSPWMAETVEHAAMQDLALSRSQSRTDMHLCTAEDS